MASAAAPTRMLHAVQLQKTAVVRQLTCVRKDPERAGLLNDTTDIKELHGL